MHKSHNQIPKVEVWVETDTEMKKNKNKIKITPITLATTFYFKSLLELLTQILHGAEVALRSDDILLYQAQVVKFLPAATECTLSLIVVLPACLSTKFEVPIVLVFK